MSNNQRTGNLTVVLNGYKRPHVLREQYQAIMEQTIKPAEVFFWQNQATPPVEFDKDILSNCTTFVGNKNLGVWARFAYALMAKTKYVCVFDDDTIPGNRWIENCMVSNKKQRGLYATVGVVYESDKGYHGPYHRVGWPSANEVTEKADLLGHSWFFERELLTAFWREPLDPRFPLCGEDIHFCYAIQKYMGLESLVPPHPKDDKSLWGSLPDKAMLYGTDAAAISNPKTNNGLDMNEYVMLLRQKGYKFAMERK